MADGCDVLTEIYMSGHWKDSWEKKELKTEASNSTYVIHVEISSHQAWVVGSEWRGHFVAYYCQ